MTNSIIFGVSYWLAALIGYTPQSGYQARLEIRQEGEMLTVIGHCRNETSSPVGLRYELSTDKKGQSGTSQNQQSGAFTVVPQQDRILSQTTINIAPNDYYLIRLRLLNEQGVIVAQDSVVHQPIGRP